MYDTIVIGAGQAGISVGYYLRKSKQKFIILDKSHEVGKAGKTGMTHWFYLLLECTALCRECSLKETSMDSLQKMKLLLI